MTIKMNKFSKTILIIVVVILGTGFLTFVAKAAGLTVEFQNGPPLFNETNFAPGGSVSKWVKVTNTSGSSQRIAIEAINFTKPVPDNDLSHALNILIKQGATEIYGGAGNEKTLYDFYQSGETYLSSVDNSGTAQYDITISFPADKTDDWQEKTTQFDVVVGFEGQEGGLPLPSPGGGTGGGGLPSGLTIQNEATVATLITETSVTITWLTSYAASSQVIYALGGEVHILDLTDTSGTPPLYGYAHTTPETDTSPKVTFHTVTISGLSSGTTYYYRTVSHASLAISQEHTFTTLGTQTPAPTTPAPIPTGPAGTTVPGVPGPGTGGPSSGIAQGTTGGGQVTGTSTSAVGEEKSTIEGGVSPEAAVAASQAVSPQFFANLLSAIGSLNFWGWLIILGIILLGLLILFLLRRRRKKSQQIY